MEAAAAPAEDKVFVAVPPEPRAGRSALSWALGHLCGGATTIVVTHVHVPAQMISVMGGKFHASKLSPEQVSLFRKSELEKADKMLDDYIHQCSKMKVKSEKLMLEKEDAASGLVELIGLNGITKLVVSAAADRHYSRKLDRPISRTAAAVMQRADPSCNIWFVCKEQLICTRDKRAGIAPAATSPVLPDLGHGALHLSTHQEEDDIEVELGFYDELQETCRAAEILMRRALSESYRRHKADEEAASSLQRVINSFTSTQILQKWDDQIGKNSSCTFISSGFYQNFESETLQAREYEELYVEEVSRRRELEIALARANREISQLRQAIQQNAAMGMEESQEATTASTEIILEQRAVVVVVDDGGDERAGSGAAGGQPAEPCPERAHAQPGHGGGELMEAQLSQRKLIGASSPSSVIPSSSYHPDDDGGFTSEADGMSSSSPVIGHGES